MATIYTDTGSAATKIWFHPFQGCATDSKFLLHLLKQDYGSRYQKRQLDRVIRGGHPADGEEKS